MTRFSEQLERISFARVSLLAFLCLAAWHIDVLFDPPYWDALTGAFAQAHWSAQHSLSPFALLTEAETFTRGGACVYPFSVYPTVVALLERVGMEARTSFAVLHTVSFAASAIVAAVTFVLSRRALGGVLAALLTLALVAQPTFRSLTMQMNMDIVLCAFTTLAFSALHDRRWARASLWAGCALLVKPTGVIVVAVGLMILVVHILRPSHVKGEPKSDSAGGSAVGSTVGTAADTGERRRLWRAVWIHFALLLAFVLELWLLSRHDKAPPGVSLFGGTLPFLGKRLWTLPEFALWLCLAIAGTAVLVLARRARRLEWELLIVTAAFTGFYCQYENVLPRYFVQVWPLVLLASALVLLRFGLPRRVLGTGFVAFAVFGLVNAHGCFHPTKWADWNVPGDPQPLVANDGWLLERSLEYRDDLELNLELAERCAEIRGAVVVANWPLQQLLAVPRFGYVTRAPRLATHELGIDYAADPIPSAGRIRPRPEFVHAVTPNVYAGEFSRVLPGDERLATFERGRLRAFLLRRPPDSQGSSR